MIKIQGKIPRKVNIAYSGGVDSRVVFEFLRKNHDVHLIYINFGDPSSLKEVDQLKTMLSNDETIKCTILEHFDEIPKGESKEHYWSKIRKKMLRSFDDVIMCHHLDDVIETWIASSLKGKPTLIPYRSGNIIRPFRLTPKEEFIKYAKRHNIKWVEDETNHDPEYSERAYIRNVLMPHAFHVNPGLRKTISRLVEKDVDVR